MATRTRSAPEQLPFGPWWSDGAGWMVGKVPVRRWGCALERGPRLPSRWAMGPDGSGSVEPSDLEVVCFVHLAAHEIARVKGREVQLLVNECHPWAGAVPEAALEAAGRGASLVPWCPGVPWHWSGEDRGKPFRVEPYAVDRRDVH